MKDSEDKKDKMKKAHKVSQVIKTLMLGIPVRVGSVDYALDGQNHVYVLKNEKTDERDYGGEFSLSGFIDFVLYKMSKEEFAAAMADFVLNYYRDNVDIPYGAKPKDSEKLIEILRHHLGASSLPIEVVNQHDGSQYELLKVVEHDGTCRLVVGEPKPTEIKCARCGKVLISDENILNAFSHDTLDALRDGSLCDDCGASV